MCNLYSITRSPRSQEAMRRLFKVRRDLAGNLPLLPAAASSEVPIRKPCLSGRLGDYCGTLAAELIGQRDYFHSLGARATKRQCQAMEERAARERGELATKIGGD